MILTLATALAIQPAPMVDPADPGTIIEALQDQGYRAELSTDGAGDPMVISSDSGVKFGIMFFGCEDNSNCKTLQFTASYSFDDGQSPDPSVSHDFDRGHRFTRTYVDDEGDPWIEMDVQVKDGPIERAEFDEALQIFLANNGRFISAIGW